MKVFLCLGFFLCMYLGSEAKVYSNCELYTLFQESGLAGYEDHSVEDWICTAKHESSYDTAAVNDNGPSRDYGVFQINSKWWCDDGETKGSVNACNIDCQDLLDDDITDDIECAKRVVEDSQGISAWVAWKKHCKGKDLSEFSSGC